MQKMVMQHEMQHKIQKCPEISILRLRSVGLEPTRSPTGT